MNRSYSVHSDAIYENGMQTLTWGRFSEWSLVTEESISGYSNVRGDVMMSDEVPFEKLGSDGSKGLSVRAVSTGYRGMC